MPVHPLALPNAAHVEIDPRKLTEYALDPHHPVGGHKARVFQSALGFTARDAALMIKRIRVGVLENPATRGVTNIFGTRYDVAIPMAGPNGRAVVRTGWIVETGSIRPKLTTLYVK